ncbi:NRT1-PTR FAMILY 7-3 protein [Nymphaea thermarum]|nr:NRT1-PTR FAMILY 7-3 protein [Nymphaea thermarum]
MKSLESSKVVSSSDFEVDRTGTEVAENAGKMALKSDGHVTKDGSVDLRGRTAIRELTGGWASGILLLLNQGLVMLAFFGVGVNLVLFLTRVMQQGNAAAANSVSKWTGTVYIFSLVGAFLSDSYWGRYKTCAIFQAIFVVGLLLLSLCSSLFLIRPSGCGSEALMCRPHTSWENGLFYLSIYLIALGNGGYQPTIATFGADQFDEEDPKESHSKLSFFSYFYFALNLGSLFSNTILAYFENSGSWSLGFWTSTGSATLALLLFLAGTFRYRHFKPSGNPLPRILQVFTAAARKWHVDVPTSGEKLYELAGNESAISGSRKILHSDDFRFLDKAATVTPSDLMQETGNTDPWRLCTVTQVEEVKCVIKMLPIWLCTILYSVVFTQMASLFVEQGAAMNTKIAGFHIPAASMSAFDILSVLVFIFVYRKALTPLAARFTGNPRGLTELQRMGTGLVIGMLAMVAAGVVELARLSKVDSASAEGSSLSIMWQIPQYSLIGASEVFMYVGQLEFFNGQAPDALKSFGSALCMASISFGNYVSSWLVSIVMWITTMKNSPGWIPGNLNHGHMDRFYFLLAGLSVVDFVVYLLCAKWYNYMSFGSHIIGEEDQDQESGPIRLPESV